MYGDQKTHRNPYLVHFCVQRKLPSTVQCAMKYAARGSVPEVDNLDHFAAFHYPEQKNKFKTQEGGKEVEEKRTKPADKIEIHQRQGECANNNTQRQ